MQFLIAHEQQIQSLRMEREWDLHYESWVIADGEPHRSAGEIFDWFAVAFWTEEPLVHSDQQERSAKPIDDFKYQIIAEITHLSEKSCIIDFGLKATSSSDRLPRNCKLGDCVAGEIYLNLPLCIEGGPDEVFKSLERRWRVNRISADKTPYIAHPGNPRFHMRDSSQVRYEETRSTESLKADGYVLHCSEVLRQ